MSTPGSRALLRSAAALLLSVMMGAVAYADDWPSWRGRTQTGVSDEAGLPRNWSPEGENLIWSDTWIGRSTPAVFDGRVCANGRTGDGAAKAETVACWNAENGTRLWTHTFSVTNTTVPFNRVGWGSVTGDPETGYLFALNVDGHLNAFDRDGRIVWSWRLAEEIGRASGYGGRTSTPVIDGDRLILSVIGSMWGTLAGPPRHRYVAFDKSTGDVLWIATPGGEVFDMNTQSVPIVAVINGHRLLIDGNADGHIYALLARTGEKVWAFNLSKRGINVSPVIDGDTVFASHSEENIDSAVMGRVVAIDATGSGDVTATHERWRIDELAVGFSSPAVKDGRLYLIDNSANLVAIDTTDGSQAWTYSVGTVGKSSPVWADGRLYVTEVNGNVHILEPHTDGVTALDHDELSVDDGRYAEIYGSFAPAYGRLYVAAESGIYCIGDAATPFRAEPGTPRQLDGEGVPGALASIQVTPAEAILSVGEAVTFRIQGFDAGGRPVDVPAGTWSLDGLAGGALSPGGELTTTGVGGTAAGQVVATVGALTARAQVRVYGPLPWNETFESGRPAHWCGGGGSLAVVDEGGEQLFQKGPSRTGIHRHSIYLGPTDMSGYTIQVDAMATQKGRRRADLGVINSGYTLDLQGNAQRLQIQSWAAELRVDERAEFAWEPNVWYTLKLQVDLESDRASIRGKVWKRDEPEPEAWTIVVDDPYPVRGGSPGLIAYSPVDIYYDNVHVMENP